MSFCRKEAAKGRYITRSLQGLPDLDEDLPLELVGRRQAIGHDVHRLGQQHVSKHLLEVGGHIPLLDDAAVILYGQDDGIAAEGQVGIHTMQFHRNSSHPRISHTILMSMLPAQIASSPDLVTFNQATAAYSYERKPSGQHSWTLTQM